MEEAFSLLAEHGVKARLTLTNMLADEDDLRDEYLNAMLAIAGRYDAEAIVYADLVGNYVRERYGMRCVLSTTRALADAAEVNRMTKRYDYVGARLQPPQGSGVFSRRSKTATRWRSW